MNKSMVRYLLSKLLLIEASLMLVPVIVAFIYKEDFHVIISLGATIGILVILGLLGAAFKPKNYHVYTKEGLLIVALCWILWSFFGALPFVLSGQIPSIIDAFFEMVSGFTTTGATICLMLLCFHTHFFSGEVLPTLSVVWEYWSLR